MAAVRVYKIEEVLRFKSRERSAYLGATYDLDVDPDIIKGAVRLTPLEGVYTEGVLLVETIRSSTVGKEHHDWVNRFRIGRHKILQNE